MYIIIHLLRISSRYKIHIKSNKTYSLPYFSLAVYRPAVCNLSYLKRHMLTDFFVFVDNHYNETSGYWLYGRRWQCWHCNIRNNRPNAVRSTAREKINMILLRHFLREKKYSNYYTFGPWLVITRLILLLLHWPPKLKVVAISITIGQGLWIQRLYLISRYVLSRGSTLVLGARPHGRFQSAVQWVKTLVDQCTVKQVLPWVQPTDSQINWYNGCFIKTHQTAVGESNQSFNQPSTK